MVKDGRFEFVNGGWVASDEACPVYEDLIENMALGHQWLKDTFDVVPRIAWLCDSFGHSSGMNQVLQWMGYESLFFGRMNINEREDRITNKTMIFNW
jgi:alpha-mannosidase